MDKKLELALSEAKKEVGDDFTNICDSYEEIEKKLGIKVFEVSIKADEIVEELFFHITKKNYSI